MPDPAETNPQLIFDWSKPRRQTARLIGWLLITGLGLAGFFFLFRVVYQPPRHFIPATNHITLLSSTDPAARALLQRVSDHDFFVFANNSESRDAPSLDEQAPVFHPSFEKHELRLQDLPQRDTKPPPVRLLDVTAPTLPRPALQDMRAPATAVSPPPASIARLSLHLTGALQARKMISTPDLAKLPPLDYTAWRFQVGVDREGRVAFTLPLATSEKPADAAEVLRLLRELRFAPDEKAASPMWGIASFDWSQP